MNPAIGVVMSSGSNSIVMPFGGRPQVSANLMPFASRSRTAFWARSVSTLSLVTSVPSTSARNSAIVSGRGRAWRFLSAGSTRRSIAAAQPSCSLLPVCCFASAATSAGALPMAMLCPATRNIGTSLDWSPMAQTSAMSTPYHLAKAWQAVPLSADGLVTSR